jgi:hypothetical protein
LQRSKQLPFHPALKIRAGLWSRDIKLWCKRKAMAHDNPWLGFSQR